jgi:hypothetical protein
MGNQMRIFSRHEKPMIIENPMISRDFNPVIILMIIVKSIDSRVF